MPRDQIVSDVDAAAGQSDRLKVGVEGYGSFAPQMLAGLSSGIAGNDAHDAIASSVHSSLHAWTAMIYADADSVTAAAAAFSETDGAAASRLAGTGGRTADGLAGGRDVV